MKETDHLHNWASLKPLILAKWDKLRKSDLEGMQPVVGELADVIQRRYEDIPRESIIQDLENLGQQILKNPEA